MYFANDSVDQNLPLYILLFKRLAKGQLLENKEEIDNVLIETKAISEGKKDIFEARNDYFYLVTYLLSNGRDFLNKFDTNAIGRKTYREVVNVLSKENIASAS